MSDLSLLRSVAGRYPTIDAAAAEIARLSSRTRGSRTRRMCE